MVEIRDIVSDDFDDEALAALLIDAVDSGAAVGFVAPLAREEALSYWGKIRSSLDDGLLLFGAYRDGRLVGSVQLSCAWQPNGRHRAEIQKLFVHTSVRRQGIARALMTAAEQRGLRLGRWLLILDTRLGDQAEPLYEKLGYVRVGTIPDYAMNSRGGFSPTVVFYKRLRGARERADGDGKVTM
jgi:GNAT superfamily N-acetyltransferase